MNVDPYTTVGRLENGHQSEIETGKANSNGPSDFNSNVKHDKTDALNDGPSAVLVNLLTSSRHLPPGMHSVLLVMALTWTSWFPFSLFDTDWMRCEVYHGDPNGDQSKKDAYKSGVRDGAFGLLLNSVVLGISSFLITPMCCRIGSKVVWAISNFIVFICMAATTIISFVSLSNFSDGIQHVLGANKSINNSALIIFSVLGFPLALLQLQKQFKFICSGNSVLDLGCATGAWLQISRLYAAIKGYALSYLSSCAGRICFLLGTPGMVALYLDTTLRGLFQQVVHYLENIPKPQGENISTITCDLYACTKLVEPSMQNSAESIFPSHYKHHHRDLDLNCNELNVSSWPHWITT